MDDVRYSRLEIIGVRNGFIVRQTPRMDRDFEPIENYWVFHSPNELGAWISQYFKENP